MAHPYDVERASDLHIEWCRDLAGRMDVRTTHQSGPQMRAVMHELRRVLAPEQVLEVANQLPALERGIFLDGWSLKERPHPVGSIEEFSERVYQRVKGHHFRVPTLVGDVFWLWNLKLGPEKSARIYRCLPEPLDDLWRSVTS